MKTRIYAAPAVKGLSRLHWIRLEITNKRCIPFKSIFMIYSPNATNIGLFRKEINEANSNHGVSVRCITKLYNVSNMTCSKV